MNSLKNKVAIITGSDGTVGAELIKKFKKEGIRTYGVDIKSNLDITNSESIKTYFGDIYKKEKHIDILINNAGITLPDSYNENEWDKTIAVNLKAPFMLSKLVRLYMHRGGSIINITSLWSELGGRNNPAYGASKGGLKTLTKCLAYDYAKFNIRVNNVGFGYIKTNMTRISFLKRNQEIKNKTMLNKWGEAADVVGLIYFLCSDEAAYITGQDFYIDGGWLAKGL